ncbi:MAG: DnaJ domain-containing protein [Beijerinckiaceae bacterium]
MPALFVILLLFLGLVFALRLMSRTPPQQLAKLVKQGAGLGALGLAGLLFVRGRVDFGAAAGALGLWLLGMGNQPGWMKGFRKAGSNGQGVSRVRSAMIEMELDHETGAMDGEVLAGGFEGKRLGELTRPQCEDLYRTCLADDPDGARLLEAYLDRRFPGWRPAGQGDGDAGGGDRQRGGFAVMTEDEAYEILGLQKGASREDVARAHRSLMKKLHPDHGGSTALAARVNEAKDILMRRHH